MRKKNKGVWVSVRLLNKHTRTSEGSRRKYTCAGKRIGVTRIKHRGKTQFQASKRSCPRRARRSDAVRRPPSWEQERRMLTFVDHIIL